MLTAWLGAVVALLVLLHIVSWFRGTLSYWKSKGVPHLRPLPILGNYLDVLTLRANSAEIYAKLYKEFRSARLVGLYEFTNPTLLVRDPRLVEEVLVRDFASYPDHGDFIFEPDSIMYNGLFTLQGQRWRALRNKLLSTFSTGRVRGMFPDMVKCCEELVAARPEKLDRESISRFAVDCFLKTLSGVRVNPEGEAELRNNVQQLFSAPLSRYLQQQFLVYYPKLADFLGMQYMPTWMDNYFRSLMNTILDSREKHGFQRKDFTDVLVELRNAKIMNVYDRENRKIDQKFNLTNELVLSQGFMFFFAGMDTTSLTMLHAAFSFASHPEVQEKARQEVRKVVEKHGGITLDAVREMKYMEQCLLEVLRLYPPLLFLMRVTERACRLGEVELEKGTRIIIPIYCLQTDPEHFPEPERFDPERFAPNAPPAHKFAHLPFSDGPRVCAGKRFALYEMATLFAHILEKYELSVDPATELPIRYQSRAVFFAPESPVLINLTSLEPSTTR